MHYSGAQFKVASCGAAEPASPKMQLPCPLTAGRAGDDNPSGQGGRGCVVRVGVEGSYYLEPSVGVGQYVHGLWREFVRGVPGLEPVLLLPGPRAALAEPIAGEVVIEEPPRRFAA